MDLEETMVEQVDEEQVDDTPEESLVEETDESEQSLESITDEGEPAEEETQKPETQGTSEPGWIKQRVNKAVEKAVRETEARMQAMFDAQMAPVREKMLNDEAKELVRQCEFKSLERAKEYLQLKQGMPVTQPEQKATSQPRNAQGQFTAKEDPATNARIDMLRHQADRIKAAGGPDVIAEFQSNAEIKQKIIAGEMDFYDVAEQMKSAPRRKPPSPMRSPNGASGSNPNAIDTMSDEQFAKLEKRIKEGARYTLK